jgi:hypothetical protein
LVDQIASLNDVGVGDALNLQSLSKVLMLVNVYIQVVNGTSVALGNVKQNRLELDTRSTPGGSGLDNLRSVLILQSIFPAVHILHFFDVWQFLSLIRRESSEKSLVESKIDRHFRFVHQGEERACLGLVGQLARRGSALNDCLNNFCIKL